MNRNFGGRKGTKIHEMAKIAHILYLHIFPLLAFVYFNENVLCFSKSIFNRTKLQKYDLIHLFIVFKFLSSERGYAIRLL